MKKRPYNPQTRYYLRGLAGLYLIYLAWSLRGELTKPGLMKLAPVLFALIGLAFALTSGYTVFWRDKDAPAEAFEPYDVDEEHDADPSEDDAEEADDGNEDGAMESDEDDDTVPEPREAATEEEDE